MPLVFSKADPHVLFLGSNVLFKTVNGGNSWDVISPDLTRKSFDMPSVIQTFASQDPEKGKHRGVIYTLAPSPIDVNLIWAGTDDGLIHLTRDGGKTWGDRTPPALTSWSKVSLMEASRFDRQTAYAAINRFRLDDVKPHILRTHDGGKTWNQIVKGLPERAVVNAVREDPVRRGLLFAATEIGVFVSFNDGEQWEPLQMNLPVTSVRDLVVHDNDLVVGTHGRSFWILDDIAPLRQVKEGTEIDQPLLFAPSKAIRWRFNRNTDTPLPPEEPAGENPPEGAVVDYILPQDSGAVELEIHDAAGKLVRRYSSADKPPITEAELQKQLNVPIYWVRPFRALPASAGAHRFVWDLRYAPPPALNHQYPIAAIYRNTPRVPLGSLVTPGRYTVILRAGRKTVSQPLVVTMDPRVKTSPADLTEQKLVSQRVAGMMQTDAEVLSQVRALVHAVGIQANASAPDQVRTQLNAARVELDALRGGSGHGRAGIAVGNASNLTALNRELSRVFEIVQGSDRGPTTQAVSAVAELRKMLDAQLSKWRNFRRRPW